MSIRTLAARGLSFAHLAGLSAKAGKAEDDKPEDEDKKDAKAEGDEPEDDDKKEDVKRADEGDDKKDAKAEDDKKDDDDGKDAKAEDEDDKKDAKADDDDSDEEMRGNSAAARARRREQARCAAIFASKAAARNPVLAANLAFTTRMSRQEALSVLEGTPASAGNSERAARNPSIGTSAAKQSPQQALAARWDQNLKAANPSRR
jgi:hypothetical protein